MIGLIVRRVVWAIVKAVVAVFAISSLLYILVSIGNYCTYLK